MFKHPKFLAYLALASVCFFWGTTYFAIKIGLKDMPPILFAGFRHIIAGLLIISWFKIKGHAWPTKKQLITNSVIGFFMLLIGNGCMVYGQQYLPSVLTAILGSTSPFWIVIISLFSSKTVKPNITVVIGLIIAFAGQVLLFSDGLDELKKVNGLTSILLTMTAVISWAIGTIYSKVNKQDLNPIFASSFQMLFGGITLSTLGISVGEVSQLNFTPEASYSLIYLIVGGSILGYGSYMYALNSLPAGLVSIYAYINTIIAMILGYFLLNEKLSSNIGVAAVLTLLGVYLINNGFNKVLNSKPK